MVMEINKEMAERFAAVREKIGIKQAEFAEALGISRPTIAGLEKGYAKITERNIKTVCQVYNINENWLKTGQGAMFNTAFSQADPINEDEEELIRMFRKLSLQTKRTILEIVHKLSAYDSLQEEAVIEEKGSITPKEQAENLQAKNEEAGIKAITKKRA